MKNSGKNDICLRKSLISLPCSLLYFFAFANEVGSIGNAITDVIVCASFVHRISQRVIDRFRVYYVETLARRDIGFLGLIQIWIWIQDHFSSFQNCDIGHFSTYRQKYLETSFSIDQSIDQGFV